MRPTLSAEYVSDPSAKLFVYTVDEPDNFEDDETGESAMPDQLRDAIRSASEALHNENYVAAALCCRRAFELIFEQLTDGQSRSMGLSESATLAAKELDVSSALLSLARALAADGSLEKLLGLRTELSKESIRELLNSVDWLVDLSIRLPHNLEAIDSGDVPMLDNLIQHPGVQKIGG